MSVDRREVIAENDLIVAFEVMDRIKDIAFRQSFTFCIFLGIAEHQETDENKGFILDEVPCPEVLVFRILLFLSSTRCITPPIAATT